MERTTQDIKIAAAIKILKRVSEQTIVEKRKATLEPVSVELRGGQFCLDNPEEMQNGAIKALEILACTCVADKGEMTTKWNHANEWLCAVLDTDELIEVAASFIETKFPSPRTHWIEELTKQDPKNLDLRPAIEDAARSQAMANYANRSLRQS